MNVFQWFYNNEMKGNSDMCHFLLSLDITSNIAIENFAIRNLFTQKHQGVTIDRNLSFNEHVSNLCKKASVTFSYFSEDRTQKNTSYHFQNKISIKSIALKFYSVHVLYNIH